ncbi:MAG: orotate phosphoribosyltransferase [Wenzhouxiangellaceae bacterium]
MQPHSQRFIELAVRYQALRFGQFTLKSGRHSPYFFNAGLFADGASLQTLSSCYLAALEHAGVAFDQLYGPAYKGIPLAAGLAIAYQQQGRNLPWLYNRKEAKDHGEGGVLVGAPAQGRVLIIDDVLSAGTSVRESIDHLRAAGAYPVAVAVALDRQEKGAGEAGAAAELRAQGLTVVSIATLDDLVAYLESSGEFGDHLPAMREYRAEWRRQ